MSFIAQGEGQQLEFKETFGKEQTLYSIHIGRFKTPSMILDDQMITFFNPGKLYGDLTVEQLATDSSPRVHAIN